ncbi:MAG: DegV family EDD domain-containing protein [Lachnospiraceae bacterium]|nr:DegV family EDD domain-containing protein [Lachnospiraceae bacterium]
MDKKEFQSDQITDVEHLLILISFTITAICMLVETVFHNWDKVAIPVVICVLIFCWALNLAQKFQMYNRIYIYVVSMLGCYFYYGIHQKSLDILTSAIVVIIMIYFITRIRSIIWMAMITYYLTTFFDFAQAGEDWRSIYGGETASIVLQYILVVLSGGIALFFISQRQKEREDNLKEIEKVEVNQDLYIEQSRVMAKELGQIVTNSLGELLVLQNSLKESLDEKTVTKDMYDLFLWQWDLNRKWEELQDYTNMISNKLEIKNEVYEVLDIVTRLKQERQRHLSQQLPDLLIDIDPMAPKALVGDSDIILKILKHLIANGLRYTKRGGVQVKIYTHTYDNACNLCIEVNDTGMGIEQSDLERILEQLDERKTADYRPGGLGLGLYLVSGFVKEMDGFFQIESELGRGTTVYVSIPQRISDAAPCLSYDKKSGICIAYEDVTYESAENNAFYEEMFHSVTDKLHIPAYVIRDRDEMQELVASYPKVCFFVALEYYEKNPTYYEELEDVYLTVVSRTNTELPKNSKGHLVYLPMGTEDILHTIEVAKSTAYKRRRREDVEDSGNNPIKIKAYNLNQRDISKHGGRRIMIVTDSMADMAPETSRSFGIPVIPFRIYTEKACFFDGVEISQECALNYLKDHSRMYSMAPSEEEFRDFFEHQLQYAEHIIYISTAKKVSVSYERACKVAEQLKNVTVFNSGHVSGGVALMAVLADKQVREGKSLEEVMVYLEEQKKKLKTSFLIDNLDQLARVGRVNKLVALWAHAFKIHPVMVMKKDAFRMGGFCIGNLSDAKETYIRRILRKKNKNLDYAVIGSVGIPGRESTGLQQFLLSEGNFNYVISRKASAAISINCGVGTFGIIYLEK